MQKRDRATCWAGCTSISSASLPAPRARKVGEFYTPRCVVKLLVQMLKPYCGRVYDPCCGSAGMFVQSVEFIEAHTTDNGGRVRSPISIYGQELNYTTWRLAKMNLAIRGIDSQIEQGDTFHNDRFPGLKADFILANPPFNMKNGEVNACGRTSVGSLAFRPSVTLTSLGCSTSSPIWRPPATQASCWLTARCLPTKPAKAKSAKTSSRLTS